MECSKLAFGMGEPKEFVSAIVVVALWSVANVVIGITIFNKKTL